jgi:TolB-like protein
MSQNLIEEDPSLNELAEKKKSDSLFSKKRLYYIISIVIAFVVCYLVVGFIFVNNSLSKDVISPNSIAVLPFKDFSPKDSQWFSDGVSDNILHSLAQMKDLSVISFTSSSTYRDTDKQIPEIAKELRVSYILEGSVTLVEGKIKIIAQLIDSNDKHIWSKEYNESFKDVITVQKNVAQEVMQQLEITLSPQEEVTLARFPTKNMKAYNLHLKGRLINGSRTLEDLEKNIELNKQAIALDSTFEEAYTEVAFSYYLLNYYHSNYFDPLEARHQATSYLEMALEVNPNSSKAWSVNAVLHMYVDWDKSKQYNEKAIALNPNDAISQTNYSNYFVDRPNPDIKKFLEHGIIAQRLNPLSSVITYK